MRREHGSAEEESAMAMARLRLGSDRSSSYYPDGVALDRALDRGEERRRRDGEEQCVCVCWDDRALDRASSIYRA
jgi:hypothetical protein